MFSGFENGLLLCIAVRIFLYELRVNLSGLCVKKKLNADNGEKHAKFAEKNECTMTLDFKDAERTH